MRGYARLGIAALMALAFSQGIVAQSTDPNSPQNVAPRTGDLAALEVQRKQLFSAMLRDPANLDIAFEYAALSVQAGDLESAISTLERMLIFAPGLSRLQFELGVLYFRLGAYETARSYLDAVAAAGDVPDDVRQQVALYQQAIDERSAPSAFSGYISTGIRYQTNANAGPASAIIDINGLPFQLSPGAVSSPDTNGFVTANLSASIDLENQGDRFDAALTAYGAYYLDQTTLNTLTAELKAGPTFNLQRFEIDNARLGIYGIFGGAMLGGDPYLGSIGVGTNADFLLDARTRLILRGEGRYEQFLDSASRPTASLRSGQRYTGSATYRYLLSPDLSIFTTVTLERKLGQTSFLNSWQSGATLGAALTFASPIAMLEAPWTFSVSTGASHKRGDAPDPAISATEVEGTTQLFVQGALTVPLVNGFSVQTSASYLASLSNYALSDFTNAAFSVGVSKGF